MEVQRLTITQKERELKQRCFIFTFQLISKSAFEQIQSAFKLKARRAHECATSSLSDGERRKKQRTAQTEDLYTTSKKLHEIPVFLDPNLSGNKCKHKSYPQKPTEPTVTEVDMKQR